MNGVANGDTKIGVACFHSGPRVRSGLLDERKGVLSVCTRGEGGHDGERAAQGRMSRKGQQARGSTAKEGKQCTGYSQQPSTGSLDYV